MDNYMDDFMPFRALKTRQTVYITIYFMMYILTKPILYCFMYKEIILGNRNLVFKYAAEI